MKQAEKKTLSTSRKKALQKPKIVAFSMYFLSYVETKMGSFKRSALEIHHVEISYINVSMHFYCFFVMKKIERVCTFLVSHAA